MDNNTILSITSDISNCNSSQSIKMIESKYSTFNHPYKYYMFGAGYDLFDDSNNSFKNYLKASLFGITFPNDYYGTFFSDAIGSSLSLLLRRFSYKDLDYSFIKGIFYLSYIYLSDTINL